MSAAQAAWPHRIQILLFVMATLASVSILAWNGASYYRLPITERPFHPRHTELRPAGAVGIRLGAGSAALFFCLYLYPIRKRFRPLQKIGKTKHWLNFHVTLGLLVPLIVTLHASLKFNGLAGMAYWIMMAIVLSGVAGRYLYSQIPRSVNAAQLSLKDLQDKSAALQAQLAGQQLLPAHSLETLFGLPLAEEVDAMPLGRVLTRIIVLDVARPFRVARLRRPFLSPVETWFSLGGLLPSRHHELESVLRTVREEAWLTAKIHFLNRAERVFHLWHVIHKPFSWSFALLVTLHVTLILWMGYF